MLYACNSSIVSTSYLQFQTIVPTSYLQFQTYTIMVPVGAINALRCMPITRAVVVLTLATEHCKLFSLSTPHTGKYCPGDGVVTPHLSPHQYRMVCLQSSTCKAYNYNGTDMKCTRLTSPCSQAVADTMMNFVVFTEIPIDQCYQWVPNSPGDTVDPRMIYTTDRKRVICRMQRDGDDRVCFFSTIINTCYASWGQSQFRSDNGYPCQRLRITEGCTVFWIPYVVRDPIHPRSVIAGHMANGDEVYVTKFNYNYPLIISLAGHYVEGADFTTAPAGGVARHSCNMMTLIVL